MKSTENIRLWTWQLPEWDLTTQSRNLGFINKGWGHDMGQKLRDLYGHLDCLLGTHEYVFCFLRYEYWKCLEVHRLWVLDVPTCQVLRYMRSEPWDRLVQSDNGPPEDDAFAGLFLSDEEVQGLDMSARACELQALLRLRVKAEWVVDRSKFSMGPAASGRRSAYDQLPTSIEEATRYRDEHSP